MPIFCISVINQSFEAHDEHDLPSLDAASAEAIRGALDIGIAEVGIGHKFFAAEVKVARDGGGEGEHLARFVVSVGVSPLR